MKQSVVLPISGVLFLLSGLLFGQEADISLEQMKFKIKPGLGVTEITLKGEKPLKLSETLPLFSLKINDRIVNSLQAGAEKKNDQIVVTFPSGITGTVTSREKFEPGSKIIIRFQNDSPDTVKIADVVPFGESENRIYLTASGPWSLARTKIFRPGSGPVGVVLPDNAWEMGYGDVPLGNGKAVCAIARRTSVTGGEQRRWWTLLPPGAGVEYTLYADAYTGPWQNGLRLMFQKRYLYDLESFDNTLFQRDDLQWIRHDYIIGLQMAWDHEFYDARRGGYQLNQFLEEGKRLFGGYDGYCIWPTWPRLGVDQRNQWDMYGDLPGGLDKLRELAEYARLQGTRFFVAYNPWDRSTRTENPYRGMAALIRATGADGVVLDTRGSSSKKLQAAADSVKSGVVMYSEGMAVPKDMPGIVAGRVHDAIYMPPPLNLNKFIKPDFAIFRVGQLYDGHLHRDVGVSFFNGYGMEINTFHPGRPQWREKVFRYLGRTTRILRENSSAFLSPDWTPLIPTLKDSIWVNEWPVENKTIYTIFSLLPSGYHGPLFEMPVAENYHFVDLWHHQEIVPDTLNGKLYLPVNVDAFDREYLGTRQEGSIDCIARLPQILTVKLRDDSLHIKTSRGKKILIWTPEPSYQDTAAEFSAGQYAFSLLDLAGRFEGKMVVQLIGEGEGELLDERVITVAPGTARLVSPPSHTEPAATAPPGMVKIPEAVIPVALIGSDESSTVRYPQKYQQGDSFHVASFYMDRYPVTNKQFKQFLTATGYTPEDTVNFLKHWKRGKIPVGQENYPVVWVSLEDARAYGEWTGKRLPTELEWQLAAGGTDGRRWPWGDKFDSTRCNVGLNRPTPVDSFPEGASPYQVMDLVGNVWQFTGDVYDNGSYYYVMIRGGSYYNPTSSWWYVKGGPQPLNKHQLMYLVAPGFNRNATVGFRCVVDAK